MRKIQREEQKNQINEDRARLAQEAADRQASLSPKRSIKKKGPKGNQLNPINEESAEQIEAFANIQLSEERKNQVNDAVNVSWNLIIEDGHI